MFALDLRFNVPCSSGTGAVKQQNVSEWFWGKNKTHWALRSLSRLLGFGCWVDHVFPCA